MTEPLTPSRASRLIGILLALLALAAALIFFVWRHEQGRPGAAPGAFAIPLDPGSRAGGRWFNQALAIPRAFNAGRALVVPAGSRVRVVYADGRCEDVTGPFRVELPAAEPPDDFLEDFLSVPLADLANFTPTGTSAVLGVVRVVSPVGVTRFTHPSIVWVAKPGVRYDVAIVDPVDPLVRPRVAENVMPPVAFEQLQSPQKRGLVADRLYDVYVREAGTDQSVGSARILVAKDAAEGSLPASPADLVKEAVAAMAKKPTRTGDAWLAVSRLPAEWSETELVIRLRLRLAAELAMADEFARAQEVTWRLLKK